MSDFEKWFKTTSAYRMLESMNYYKMDLFHWIEARGEYRHTSVQIAFMTWVEQQAKIDELNQHIKRLESKLDSLGADRQELVGQVNELQKRVDAAKQLIEDLNKCYQQDHQNKFEYWRGFADSAGILRKRLEQALKGGNE